MAVASFPNVCGLFLSGQERLRIRKWRGRNSALCSPSINEPFASRSVVQIQPTEVKLKSDSCFGVCKALVGGLIWVQSRQVSKSLLALIGIFAGSFRGRARVCGHRACDALAWVVLLSGIQASWQAGQGASDCCCLCCTSSVNKQGYSGLCCSCSFDPTFKKVTFLVFALISFFSLSFL